MKKTEGDGIVVRRLVKQMIWRGVEPEEKSRGIGANSEEADKDVEAEKEDDAQPGLLRGIGRYYRRQSSATQAVAKTQAAQKALGVAGGAASKLGFARTASFIATFGPEIIAGLLVLLAIFVTVISLTFVICSYQGCNGKYPGDTVSDPINNKQDSLELKTIQCLAEASKNNSNGDGPLPAKCLEPIQGWSQQIIESTQSMINKLPTNPTAAEVKAKELLNKLLAAANAAHGVTTATTVKQARELRQKLADAITAANADPVILKLRGVSLNAQRIIDYVVSKGSAATTQPTGSACRRTVDAVMRANFQGQSVWRSAGAKGLGGIVSTVEPTKGELDQVRAVLANGDLPVWQVHGDASGKHFIIILNVDSSNQITFFDPNGGVILTKPSSWPGPQGNYKFFFGSPFNNDLGTNSAERGYIFPSSGMKPEANPGNPIVLSSEIDK